MPLFFSIGRMKAKGDVAGLAKALRHRDAGIRRQASEALIELGGPRTVHALVDLAISLRSATALTAGAEILDRAVDASSVRVLTDALMKDASLVRMLLRTSPGCQILRVALLHSDEGVRSHLGSLMLEVAEDRSGLGPLAMLAYEFDEVKALMWPPEPEEQRAAREATEAAARQEAERRARPLRLDLARLQEIEAMASIEAVRARPDAVEVLASAVRAACRRVASIQSRIQANRDFGDSIERAIQDEIDQFGSIDEDRSTYLRRQWSPVSVGPRALTDGQEGAERYSVELARLSPAAVLATLKELSQDEDVSIRRSASACLGRVARELGQVGDASAVPVLVAALTEALVAGDEKAAERLRRALEALGPMTTSVLVDSLGDQAQLARWTIVRLLGRVGSIEALPALRSTLDDEDESVRGEAEFAIAEIERRAAIA